METEYQCKIPLFLTFQALKSITRKLTFTKESHSLSQRMSGKEVLLMVLPGQALMKCLRSLEPNQGLWAKNLKKKQSFKLQLLISMNPRILLLNNLLLEQ